MGLRRAVGPSPSFPFTLVGGQWHRLQRPWRQHKVGTEGAHLDKVVRRRKRGIQEETKGPQRTSRGPESQGDKVHKLKSDKSHRTLSDMATRRPARQTRDCRRQKAVGQGLKGVGEDGRQLAAVW